MKNLAWCGLALLLVLKLQAQEAAVPGRDPAPVPLTVGKRFQIYLKDTYGPLTFLGAGFSGAIDHLRNEPPEWKQGAEGYGRRSGSWFGQVGIKDTIEFGVAALDGEDPRYRRSKRKGVWGRSYDASLQTIFRYRVGGGRTFAFSVAAGALSSGLIANAWYPDSRSSWGDGLVRGSALITGDVGNNLFQEFWPDIKAKIFHRKKTGH
jgi:hypothetical protein